MQKRVIQVFGISVLLLMFTAALSLNAFAANITAGQVNPVITNPYSPAYQHSYRHGAVPTIAQLSKINAYQQAHQSQAVPAATSANTLSYGGGIDGIGVTSGHEKVYLVFWGTQWGTQSTDGSGNLTFSNDSAGGAPWLQKLFKGLGTGSEQWSGTMTQYCDGSGVSSGATSCSASTSHVGYPTGGALSGVWYDNASAEPGAASGNQLANEAIRAAGHFGNTSASSNRYSQYVILSATGTNPDNYETGGFCAWHDYNGDTTLSGGGAASSPYGDISFTNMPYVMDQGSSCGQNFVNSGSAGTLDGYTIVEGHEYAETITDQNPAGGWTNSSSGAENGDECAWISPGQAGGSGNVSTGAGTFAMQSTWSNDTNACALAHATIGGGSGGVTLPGTWSQCAGENGTCAFSGTMTVAFGANGKFNYATLTNGTACTTGVFGDPIVGTAKACYIESVPSTTNVWSQCAGENGTCAFSGTMTVAYGANGKFNYATLTNGTACSNGVFGDPIVGTAKACYLVAPPATTATWISCAGENSTCSFTSTHEVAYGANGQFFYKSLTNGTVCSNGVFGDPIAGTVKNCYYQ